MSRTQQWRQRGEDGSGTAVGETRDRKKGEGAWQFLRNGGGRGLREGALRQTRLHNDTRERGDGCRRRRGTGSQAELGVPTVPGGKAVRMAQAQTGRGVGVGI